MVVISADILVDKWILYGRLTQWAMSVCLLMSNSSATPCNKFVFVQERGYLDIEYITIEVWGVATATVEMVGAAPTLFSCRHLCSLIRMNVFVLSKIVYKVRSIGLLPCFLVSLVSRVNRGL